MLRKILTVAIFAGVISGLVISIVQEFTTTPIILHAEDYENASAAKADMSAVTGNVTFMPAAFIKVHAGITHTEAPDMAFERLLYTVLGNVITGVGFGLILVASFALYGQPVDGRQGVIWGAAAFVAFALAPGLGLPPEVPGTMAADLTARQAWWIPTALSTALGLWLMIFRHGWGYCLAGIAVITLPHLIGAPQPDDIGGDVPPELAGHFVAASLATAAIFWAMLGWLSGTLFTRFSEETD